MCLRSATFRVAAYKVVTEPNPCRSCHGADPARARSLAFRSGPHVPRAGAWSGRTAIAMDTGDTAWLLMSTALVMIMLPGPGALLRRPGPQQERAVDGHAQLLRAGPRQRRVGRRRLHARLRARRRRARPDRRPRLRDVQRRRAGAQRRPTPTTDPVRPVRGVPADVRGDHAGAHHRRVRRAQAVRARSSCSRSSGRSSSTRRWPTGSGRPTAGCSSSARSTSPAAPSSTSARASRPSSSRC